MFWKNPYSKCEQPGSVCLRLEIRSRRNPRSSHRDATGIFQKLLITGSWVDRVYFGYFLYYWRFFQKDRFLVVSEKGHSIDIRSYACFGWRRSNSIWTKTVGQRNILVWNKTNNVPFIYFYFYFFFKIFFYFFFFLSGSNRIGDSLTLNDVRRLQIKLLKTMPVPAGSAFDGHRPSWQTFNN